MQKSQKNYGAIKIWEHFTGLQTKQAIDSETYNQWSSRLMRGLGLPCDRTPRRRPSRQGGRRGRRRGSSKIYRQTASFSIGIARTWRRVQLELSAPDRRWLRRRTRERDSWDLRLKSWRAKKMRRSAGDSKFDWLDAGPRWGRGSGGKNSSCTERWKIVRQKTDSVRKRLTMNPCFESSLTHPLV